MDRRDFVGSLIAPFAVRGAAAAVAPARPPSRTAYLAPLGVQLYMVRDAMRRDPDATLARVAELGYREVELWSHHGRTPQQLRATLDRLGLTAPSRHVGLADLEDDAAARTLAEAAELGHRYLVVAWIDERERRTIADWRRVADRFNRAGERVRAAGLQLAYHNHGYDGRPLEGQVPLDVFASATDPALVQLQLDVFWLIDGGGDPLAFMRRWPGRICSLHFKDRGPGGEQRDIGAGTIDWRAVLRLRERAGVRHYFMDIDDPPDPFASLRASYEFLSRLDV